MTPSHAFSSLVGQPMNTAPPTMLDYERGLHAAGYRAIVGLDEVGRGALAGPIVAAAVVLPAGMTLDDLPWREVADSKTLIARKREELARAILDGAAACAVALLDAPVIDEIGIGPANRMVMEAALRDIEARCDPDFLLIDALTIDHALPQIGIIDGDARSLSVAAASIVAKVHRDAIMTSLSGTWPDYGWDRNKGYGVATHLDALRCNGPCEHHRYSFRPVTESAFARHG
jgi:ribonuclease HII